MREWKIRLIVAALLIGIVTVVTAILYYRGEKREAQTSKHEELHAIVTYPQVATFKIRFFQDMLLLMSC